MASSSERIEAGVPRTQKDKSCLLRVLENHLEKLEIDRHARVLVLGGGEEDVEILSRAGFHEIVLSNIGGTTLDLDAEAIQLPDNSYPLVFAHAVLHHCRCPHRAVGEMVRVAEKAAFFFEPNDSLALRTLVRLGFSFPYELAAVIAHDCREGGVRNGPVPNYIYRWTRREVEKCVAAYHAERRAQVFAYPYWDFYANGHELLARRESRVAELAEGVGAENLVRALRSAQFLLNLLPAVRSQGNKFFCAITKKDLHPWMEFQDGQYRLRKKIP